MNKLIRAKKYINHRLTGSGKHGFGIHSPFIFNLTTRIITDYTPFHCYNDIEKERKTLLKNKQSIHFTELGAGSKVFKSDTRKISDIAKYSLTKKKQAQLLFRLANHFNHMNILEFGTSLGITSSYFSKLHSKAKVISLEGCPETAKIAEQTLSNLKITNTTIMVGEFNQTLTEALSRFEQFDMVYFDGNHKKEPTLQYFHRCLEKIHNKTVFIFDDIHLTNEMEQAWNEIKENKNVSSTLDLFHLGIVFFRKELSKFHYNIKF